MMRFDSVTEFAEVYVDESPAEVHVKLTSGGFWIDIVVDSETAREMADELLRLADEAEAE